jgi:hypothetical protein
MSQSIFALLFFAMALAFKGGIALNILTAGSTLFGNQTQYLSNSGYYAVVQPDCNFVLYQCSTLATCHQYAQSNTMGSGSDCWLTMQEDGNLVLYNATCGPACVKWEATSYGSPGYADSSFFLMLQSNGELDIYNFENDNPKLYFTIVASSLNPSATFSPPSCNLSLSTTPTFFFDGPYMAIGYYLPKLSSLQNGPFSLTLENDCTLQSKIESSTVLWENSSNGSGINQQCELTLQQDGNLQIQTTDTKEILWTTNTPGDSSVSWVLYIDSITGDLSIGDIMQPTHILWKNTFGSIPPIASNRTTHSGKWLILELVGGFLLGIASLVLTYYACASKYPKYNCFNSIAFIS